MGNCKDCKDWSQNRNEFYELWSVKVEGIDLNANGEYGGCASGSHKKLARYDGGYNGELITHAEFGCTEFKAK